MDGDASQVEEAIQQGVVGADMMNAAPLDELVVWGAGVSSGVDNFIDVRNCVGTGTAGDSNNNDGTSRGLIDSRNQN